MLRKYSAILFLIAAQIVILGHGIVSHHHHIDIVNGGDHNTPNNHHKNSKETPLEIAFSGFIHTGDQASFTNSTETRIVITKDDVKSLKALPVDFIPPVEYIVFYQKHTFPPDRHTIYLPPLRGAYSLRGPPTFIVA
ncbi:hypothetical protein ACR79B_07175 [Sphingobacterium spiritivorum]|uniref:hypothetical protein n=1 Tax=Sphingobacterium spiritivorum TaxID=258 RepID=UPI003DA1CCDE